MTTVRTVKPPRIRVATAALKVAESVSRASVSNEVGGILVGWWEDHLTAVVEDLLQVDDAAAHYSGYVRRQASAQVKLDQYQESRDGRLSGYIGEWHSHPREQPPSAVDVNSFGSIVRQVRAPVALLVLAPTRDSGCEVFGLVGRYRFPRRAIIESVAVERI